MISSESGEGLHLNEYRDDMKCDVLQEIESYTTLLYVTNPGSVKTVSNSGTQSESGQTVGISFSAQ